MAKKKLDPPVDETVPPSEAELPPEEVAAAQAAEAPPEGEVPPPVTAEGEAPPEEVPETLPEEVPEETGVATPDGQGVLPHQVLVAERERAAAAEAKAAELETALQNAQAALAEAAQANAQLQDTLTSVAPEGMAEGGQAEEAKLPDFADIGEIPEEEHGMLDTLEMPGISAAIKQIPILTAHVKALTSLVQQLVEIDNERYQHEQEEEAREQASASEANRNDMVTALDNLPLARYYEAQQPEAWADFIAFHDDHVNKHPEHSKLPHAERFRKALDMAKAIHGDVNGLDKGGKILPEEGTKATAEELPEVPKADEVLDIDLNKPPTNTSDEDNVKKLSDEELAKKVGAPKVVSIRKSVTTLGSIPGGESADNTDDTPLIKKQGIKAFQKAMAEAKTPEEAARIQEEWARAG